MKCFYSFFLLLAVALAGCATVPYSPETSKIVDETVRSKMQAFRRNLKVEIMPYREAKIENVYLEHGRKKEKIGEKDYIYVHGTVVNRSISFLSGAVVRAEFFDDTGKLISDGMIVLRPRLCVIEEAADRKDILRFESYTI